MTNLRRIVHIAGLGMPKSQTEYIGTSAYEDLHVFFGDANFGISDGSKIFGIVIDVMHSHPMVMSDAISLFEPLVSFGSAECAIQLGSGVGIRDVSQHTSNYRYRWLGQYVNEFLSSGGVEPWGYFRVEKTPGELDVATWPEHTATGILYFKKRGWQPDLFPGDVLFWGREALQVASAAHVTPGSISGFGDANYRATVIKRAYGTRHERHGSSLDGNEDIEIYRVNPIILGREVTVYDYDVETEELIWLHGGFLEAPSNDDNQHILKIRSQGGSGAINQQIPGQQRAFFPPVSPGDSGGEFQIHKRYFDMQRIPVPSGMGTANSFVGAIGEAIVLANYRLVDQVIGGQKSYEVTGIAGSLMSTVVSARKEKEGEDRGVLEEVLSGGQWTHFRIDEGSGRVYNTHPFDVVRCLLISDRGDLENKYDVLPDGWGLRIPYDRFDHEYIDNLRDGVFGGFTWVYKFLSMPSLLIKGNSDETAWSIVSRILKPLLCVLTQDEDGLYVIRTVMDLGPEYVEYAYAEDDFMMEGTAYESSKYDPVREIRYNIARRGNSDNYSGELRSSDLRNRVEKRYGFLSTDEEVSALDYGRPGQVPVDWTGMPETFALMSLCSVREQMRNSFAHHYRIRVRTNRDNVGVARLVTLSHPVLIGNRGERGIAQRRMLTLSHQKTNTSQSAGESIIDVIDVEAFSQSSTLIAPSWHVSSVTQPVPFGNYNSVILDTTEYDDDRWEQDQVVTFVDKNFAPIDGGSIHTVTDAAGTTRRINPGFPSNPGSDIIMLLAKYDDAWSEDLEKYTWIADNNDELGSTPDEAHKWGF